MWNNLRIERCLKSTFMDFSFIGSQQNNTSVRRSGRMRLFSTKIVKLLEFYYFCDDITTIRMLLPKYEGGRQFHPHRRPGRAVQRRRTADRGDLASNRLMTSASARSHDGADDICGAHAGVEMDCIEVDVYYVLIRRRSPEGVSSVKRARWHGTAAVLPSIRHRRRNQVFRMPVDGMHNLSARIRRTKNRHLSRRARSSWHERQMYRK